MDILLSPPLAFLIYLPLVIAIFLVGKGLAGKSNPNPEKSSLYGSGELAPTSIAALDTSPFSRGIFLRHAAPWRAGSGYWRHQCQDDPAALGLILALVALILG